MAVKKTQLYASLWASCDKLRGGMDSSEYKDYILTLLFMKYVTDKYKNKGAYEDIIPLNLIFITVYCSTRLRTQSNGQKYYADIPVPLRKRW